MMVITEQDTSSWRAHRQTCQSAESTICCYNLTVKPEGLLKAHSKKFSAMAQSLNCKVVIIQTDSSHGSVLAEALYNGVGTLEDEAQNNNTTPRLAGGPPTASSARQSNVSYASLEESNKHAKDRCVHHINILRERESVTGIRVPTEVYSEMHYTEECVSPDNPYLACTKFPGGMDAVIKIYAIQDDEIRKIEWMRAMSVMRQIMEQRTQTTNVVEEVHNSADAEDAGTREVSDSVCDLNGEFYRVEHRVRLRDETCESYTTTRNNSVMERCPRAPVHRGSGDISWGSSAAERARQAATRLCGRVIVFTARHDCFALTSSVLHVGDSSSSWGKGLRAAGFENIIKRYNKSNKWIEISAKEFGNDPHEFVKRVEYNGGTVLTHGGNRYIDTDTILRNTYEGIDTVQITFDREGRVIRHSSIRCTGNSRMTQLLLNVEDGYGHVVVMVGNAADVIRRCNEQCEPTEIADSSQDKLNEDNTEAFHEIMVTKFQRIYYGMADAEDTTENYMTNCEPELYLRMVNLGALEQTGSQQLVEDAVTIHTELTGHHTGDTDINESTILTLANTQDMLTQFRQVSQRILLILDRRGHGNLDSTRDMSSHVWYKARIKRNANGNLEVKNQPYRIQSTEYVKIGEAMVSATNIRMSNTEATIPTVIGRIRDLGDEFVVGMFISEMLADTYHITPGPWMEKVDQLYDGIHVVVPEYLFSQTRSAVKCYYRSQADVDMEYKRWTAVIKASSGSQEAQQLRLEMIRAKHAEYTRGCNAATQWCLMADQMYSKETNYSNHGVQWQPTVRELRQVAARYNEGRECLELSTSVAKAANNSADVVIKLQQSNYQPSNYLGLKANSTARNTTLRRTGPRAPTMGSSLAKLQEARDALTKEAREHQSIRHTAVLARQEPIYERQEQDMEDSALMAIESLTQHVACTTMNQVDEAKRELGAANQELAKDNKALMERLSESTRDLDKAESNATDMEGACNIMEAEKKHAVEAWKAAELRLETAENEHAEAMDDKNATISQNRILLKAAQELSMQLEREIVQFRSDKEVDQKKNDALQDKYDEACREQAAFEQCINELEQYKRDLDLCQQELEQEQALVKSVQESDSETTDNLNKSSIRVNELEQQVNELQMSQDTDALEELRSRTEQVQQGADTILQLRRVLKRQKKDNDRVLSIAHKQIDRQIEEIEDTKQESQSQTDLANEARLELNIHRQSHGAAQQTTDSIMQGTELVRQENNDKLLINLNKLRKAIQQHTGHTMNNIQMKKSFDTSKVCNVLQEMAAQLGKEAERVTTADNQGEEHVNIACTVEKQADAIQGIQELIFNQGDDVERVFRNDIREGIPWMEAMSTAFGAPGDFQMGEVITQSAIGEQGRRMVRETAKETEADGGHRQRINDFITGLDRTAAFVHELAQAALKSKGSQQDNKEIADKSGSLLSEVSKTRDRVYVEETVGHRNNWFRRAAVMTILRLERDAKPINFRRHNEQELLKLEADAEVLQAQAKSLKRTNRASQERHAVGIKAKEEAIESMMQEQHRMSVDLASKDCIIQDLETAVEGRKQEIATMEKRWNDAQSRLNTVSRSTDQATHKDGSFTAQEMEVQ